ncbi:Uncharacterised protein [Klebsiella pneumoniae]|nr:Uncharacterised protein [Klebsiella pneumoniae]
MGIFSQGAAEDLPVMILLGMYPAERGIQLGGQVILQVASKQHAAFSKFITVAQYHFTGRGKCGHRWLL